ncbi:MAG: hypothetical protein ACRD7E_23165 [Bryobacteraceae bacterium]
MRSFFAALVLLSAAAGLGARSDYLSVKNKFSAIEKRQVGAIVLFPASELNAYVQTELPQVAPEGIRDPLVELQGNNIATGTAQIDFLKMRSAQGKSSNWLLTKLLEGEREVAVTTRLESSGGTATVHIQKVEIEGVPIQGAALDFLINNYLRPNYPTAKIGEPFELGYGMERIEVKPGVARVIMTK